MLNNINKNDLFYEYYTQWIAVYKEVLCQMVLVSFRE